MNKWYNADKVAAFKANLKSTMSVARTNTMSARPAKPARSVASTQQTSTGYKNAATADLPVYAKFKKQSRKSLIHMAV